MWEPENDKMKGSGEMTMMGKIFYNESFGETDT